MRYFTFCLILLLCSVTLARNDLESDQSENGDNKSAKPIICKDIKYFVMSDSFYYCEDKLDTVCGNRVTVHAYKPNDYTTIWETELLRKFYSDLASTVGVGAVKATSLKMDKNKNLVIIDSKGSKYVLDHKTGKFLSSTKHRTYKSLYE